MWSFVTVGLTNVVTWMFSRNSHAGVCLPCDSFWGETSGSWARQKSRMLMGVIRGLSNTIKEESSLLSMPLTIWGPSTGSPPKTQQADTILETETPQQMHKPANALILNFSGPRCMRNTSRLFINFLVSSILSEAHTTKTIWLWN